MSPGEYQRRQYKIALVNFAQVEIELGTTFCALARTTRGWRRAASLLLNVHEALAQAEKTRKKLLTIGVDELYLDSAIRELQNTLVTPETACRKLLISRN